MTRNIKYDYDIDLITRGVNENKTVSEIARENGWCRVSARRWLIRNYKRIISYEPIDKKSNK